MGALRVSEVVVVDEAWKAPIDGRSSTLTRKQSGVQGCVRPMVRLG